MKKTLALCLCLAMLLAGCSEIVAKQSLPEAEPLPQTEPLPETIPVTQDTQPAAMLDDSELLAVSVPMISERFEAEDGTEIFTYQRQHMQLIFPDADVAEKVILDFLNRVDTTREDAESILNAAKNDYTTSAQWFPYFYQIIYSPTRIDYGVLSLFGVQNSFSGGMHGSKSCIAANYDLMTGDVLTLGSIMHMDASKEDFIEIITEKLESDADSLQLYSGFEEGVRSRLNVDENLYEDFYFTTTGLCFFFSPYEIAPYSSGIITVEIPYNELPGLIYDGYFPAEREQIHGDMQTGYFKDIDMDRFNNMAEATLTNDGETLVVYPEGTVEDVRITIAGDGKTTPDYTVFSAYEMHERDAVVINLDADTIGSVEISYYSGETSVTIPLAE